LSAPKPKQPYRIAIIEGGSGYGGSARSLLRIANGLHTRHRDLIAPHYCFLQEDAPTLFNQAGHTTHIFQTRIRRFFECRRFLRKQNIQLLHCNNEPYSHLYHILAARSLGLPITIHFRGNRTITRREQWLMTLMAKGVAVGEKSRQNALDASGLNQDCIVTIGDGIDLGEYQQAQRQRSEMRKQLQLQEHEIAVLIPSTLQPGKGQETAIAAAVCNQSQLPLRWFFVGDEHYQFPGFKQCLLQQMEELGLSDQCHLLGHREDIPELLAAGDLMVMPSTLREGMPCVIMEAMAASLPVFASDIGGIPEAVSDTVGGLFPPGDGEALYRLIQRGVTDNTLENMGAQAHRFADTHFNIGRAIDALVKEWRVLLSSTEEG
jgi:glycosyltransferase involved in cell wall biosynthesis